MHVDSVRMGRLWGQLEFRYRK